MAPSFVETVIEEITSLNVQVHETNAETPLLNVDDLLEQLTLEEKVDLTAGKDFWHTVPIPRLNIPSIRLSDGPNGIRGTRFFDSVPAACLPCGTAIGATFDAKLANKIGHLLADEAKAKGAHVILGPTINIQRSPLGGRGFESYSEDPYLSGVLAGQYCKGVKEKNIVATLKHFVCNDQEHERMAVNAIVTERALREIYLEPFRIAVKMSQPGAVMTSYSKLNGMHVSENKSILQDVLRDEWKWDGLVMSDWFGTYSASEAIQAGLDLEMPGPTRWRGSALTHAVSANKVKISQLNDRVRNVLRLINTTSKSGVPEAAPETRLNRKEDQELLRKIAGDSIVLLKNEGDVLPLRRDKRIAVIGPNSRIATYCGGGSASLNPYYTVTPFEGIRNQATAGVDFAQGAYGHQMLPLLGKQLKRPDGSEGFTMKVFNEAPGTLQRTMIDEKPIIDSMMFFVDYSHPKLADMWYADCEGIFTPEQDGQYDFSLTVHGTAKLYVDGELVVNNAANQTQGVSFLGTGTVEVIGSKELVAGKASNVLIQYGCAKTSSLKVPSGVVTFGQGGLRFGGCKNLCPKQGIEEAVRIAKSVDQVVLFAGLSGEWESEGEDRPTMDLPPRTDALIFAVLEANPNTAIVIQSGTPVSMPWADKAKTVLQAWFGGNETGNGIADVVYGTVNPSAKLPLTMPRRVQDNPAYLNYRSEGGRVLYGEDIYVGYRHYERLEVAPLFPFGHGLSYTTFTLSDLRLSQDGSAVTASVKVSNTGTRPGAEVVQLYIAPLKPPINRPVKELKAFEKVFLESSTSSTVDVVIDLKQATSFWDEHTDKWCSHAGKYRVLVGNSSDGSFLEEIIEVEKTSFWTGL
jgi:beta-glucosidase